MLTCRAAYLFMSMVEFNHKIEALDKILVLK